MQISRTCSDVENPGRFAIPCCIMVLVMLVVVFMLAIKVRIYRFAQTIPEVLTVSRFKISAIAPGFRAG